MSKALITMPDGVEEVEVVSIIDVLRRGGVETVVASMSDKLKVAGAHGLEITADQLFKSVMNDEFDAVILPGGPGVEALKASNELADLLCRHQESGRLIGAICAAPVVLTDFGVVPPEISMTCYPTCVMDLDRRASNVPVVHDGNFITGQAPGSAMLFALVVLQALVGPAVASKVARALVYEDFGA